MDGWIDGWVDGWMDGNSYAECIELLSLLFSLEKLV